ncbi:MAG: Sec-independent protein translocase protein TatB [Acidimicrobiales bacterium]
MFNIGGGEFLVIALIALIVLGPQRLPEAARQAGKAMAELRRMSSGFQNEIKGAFTESEVTTATPTPRGDLGSGTPGVNGTVTAAVSAVSGQAPVRRTPLKASPASTRKAPAKAAPAAKTPAAKRTSATRTAGVKKAAAASTSVPKASRPRTKGS